MIRKMLLRKQKISTRAKTGAVIATLFVLSMIILLYFMIHSNRQQQAYQEYSQQQVREASGAIADIWETHLYWVIYDFSTWDDMVAYAADPSSLPYDMLEAYLDDLLPWYEINGVWIFDLSGELVYENKQHCAERLTPADFSAGLKEQLHEEKLTQFYRVLHNTLVLIQGATIHHTEDTEREGEPQGYMFFAKCWSGEPLNLLEAMTGSDISAAQTGQGLKQESVEEGVIQVSFQGKEGEDAALLIFRKKVDFADLLQEKSRSILIILLSSTILAFVALMSAMHHWVNKPLKLIAQTIQKNSKEHIPELRKASSEFAMIGDLTETFIQQKEDLIEQKEKAEEANRLKTAFLANVSHEIRTPMTGILGFSELLKTEANLSEEEQKQYLDLIYSNGQLLLRLIDDLIDLAKIDSGNISIKHETFDVSGLMLELYANYQKHPLLQQKDIQLILDEAPDAQELKITTDRFRLYQVLSNLLSNAIKFTEKGWISIGYYLSGDEEIHFFVEDTGQGVSKDDQEKIFERFVQLPSGNSNPKQQGTGLGLPICKGITDLLNGKIEIQSEPDKGAKFIVILPVHSTIRTS